MRVLYEDNHLIVVEKPVNVPVQADQSGDPDLLTQVKAYVKQRYHKQGEVYIGLVHRLDRPVGGAMVFARTSKAAARLSQAIRVKEVRRTYWAVVHGAPPLAEGELTHYLAKDPRTYSSRTVDAGAPGAKLARLHYRVLAQRAGMTLVEVRLMTGRSHQIRVQLAASGCPIVGDQRYGTGNEAGVQIALWSRELALLHPVRKEELRFTCPPPPAWPWTEFS